MPLPNLNSGQQPQQQQTTTDERSLEERLQEVEKQSHVAPQLAQILAVPGVAELLEKAQKGEKVKVLTESELQAMQQQQQQKSTTPEEDIDNVDFENLDNRELFKLASKQSARIVLDEVQKLITPLTEKLGSFEQHAKMTEQEKARAELERVRSTDPQTFDSLRKEMFELAGQAPGLSMDDLFNLAKIKKGIFKPSTGTLSERPSGTSAKPPKQIVHDKPLTGVGGFRQAIAEAMSQKTYTDEDFGD